MLSFLLAILVTPMVGISTSKFHLNTNRFGKFLFDFLAALLLISVTQMWLLNFGASFRFTKLVTLYAIFAFAFLWVFSSRLRRHLVCNFSNILSFKNVTYLVLFWTMASLLTFLQIYENDFLEYLSLVSQLNDAPNFGLFISDYPLDETSWSKPLYAPSSHNPVFHTILAMYSGSFLDQFAFSGLMIMFGLSIVVHSSYSRKAESLSMFIFISTPLLIFAVMGSYIDIPRLAFSTAALRLIALNMQSRNPLILCLSLPFVLSIHSLGLVVVFVVFLTILCISRNFIYGLLTWKNVVLCSLVISVSTPQIIFNIIDYGKPFQDDSPIQQISYLYWPEDLLIRRNIHDFHDRFFNGVLTPIFNLSLFGTAGLLLIFFLIVVVVRGNSRYLTREPFILFNLLFLTFYFSLVFILTLFGFDTLIKNIRYQLTYFPSIIAVLGFIIHSKIWSKGILSK